MPREILVDWTMASGGGKVSVFWFTTGNPIASQRAALNTFLSSLDGSLSSSVAWSIQPTGREVDDTTGTLTGSWSEPTAYSGVGGVGTEQVADATQILYQWHTGEIVNGRFLRGRSFFPGLAASNLTDGNITPAVVTGFTGYGTTLIAAAVGLSVWHRPVGGAGGQREDVDVCTVWPELAVLRRRRG